MSTAIAPATTQVYQVYIRATPEQIWMLLRRCLENDRSKRLPDISVAQFLITERITVQPAVARVESRRHVRLAAVIAR